MLLSQECVFFITNTCLLLDSGMGHKLPSCSSQVLPSFFHLYDIANYHENSFMVGKGKELSTSIAAVGDTISGKLKTISCTVGKKGGSIVF